MVGRLIIFGIGILFGMVITIEVVTFLIGRSYEKKELSKADWKMGYRQK